MTDSADAPTASSSTAAASAERSGAAASPGAGVPPAPRLVRRRALLGSRRRQVIAAAVVAAAIAFVVVEGLGNATEYYKTVPQAVADRSSLGTRHFRIMGTVDDDVRQVGNTTTFSITYERVTAQVVDTKEPPQLFKPGVPVVLEGNWAGNVFQSDLIMIKHTSNYTPPTDPYATTQTPK
ncbi:MAG: cytochrome c maturation protein CcmE [Acidobacteriota bacterium]|nr:cytochrome c maturation protein CcmE [Acidobacteriota bacterium]